MDAPSKLNYISLSELLTRLGFQTLLLLRNFIRDLRNSV